MIIVHKDWKYQEDLSLVQHFKIPFNSLNIGDLLSH